MAAKIQHCTLPGCPAAFIAEASGPCPSHRVVTHLQGAPRPKPQVGTCQECGEPHQTLYGGMCLGCALEANGRTD